MYTLTRSRVITEIQTCLSLAVPLAGAQLAQSATAFVDTVMMGWLGSQTIAAGGLGATLFNMTLITSSSVVAAVSPLAAEAHGAGQAAQVQRIVRQGLWLALLIAIPVTLLIWHAGTLLCYLGQSPATAALSSTYLQAIAWGFLPSLGFAVLRHFISALSITRPIMVIFIGGTLFNVIANYVLMFGKLGLPALGLAGIGWASTVALWLMFIAMIGYVLSQPQLRAYQIFQGLHQFDWGLCKALLRVGVPIGVLAAVEVGLFGVTALLMGHLGSTALAAHQVALQTAAVTFMVPLGISLANTVRVGQLVGQGSRTEVQLAGSVGIGIGALFMGAMGIIFWTIPDRIVSLYLDVHDPANADVVALAKALLGVAAVFQLVDGLQVTILGALRGLKDTYIPMVIGVVAYWGIGLPSGYLLGLRLGFGGVGLWWGLAIGLALAAIVLAIRFGLILRQMALYEHSQPARR